MLIYYTPRNILEEPRPDLYRGRSLKLRKCYYAIFIISL